MKRFIVFFTFAFAVLPLLADDATPAQEEKALWDTLFGKVKAEDQLVSEEEVEAELVRLVEKRKETLAQIESNQIEEKTKALPLSVQGAPKDIRERAEKTIRQEARRKTLEQESAPLLAEEARLNLQKQDALHHNQSVNRRRWATVGTLGLSGSALTAYSFTKLTEGDKLVSHINSDPQVEKALDKLSALRKKLGETDSRGVSRMTKLKGISQEIRSRIAAFEKNVNEFIHPSLVKRFEEATRNLEAALAADQTMAGKTGEFHHSVRRATGEFESARKAIEIAKSRALGKMRRELYVAETYRRDLEAAKTKLARAREWSLYKAQKLYPSLRKTIKVAGVVSGTLIIGTAAGLAYTWGSEELAPDLDQRLSRSFLRSDPHYLQLYPFQARYQVP